MRADAAEAASQTRISRERLGPVILISSVFFVIASIILCYPGDPVPYKIGEKPPKDIVSPVTFMVQKPQLKENLDVVRKLSAPVLRLEANAWKSILSQLSNLPLDLRGYATFESVPADLKEKWKGLTPENFAAIQSIESVLFNREVENLMSTLDQSPLVDVQTLRSISGDNRSLSVWVTSGPALDSPGSQLVPKQRIIVLGGDPTPAAQELRDLVAKNIPRALVELVTRFLLDQKEPVFTFDAKLTQERQEQEVAAQPPGSEEIQTGAVIVSAGREIDRPLYEKLRLAQSYYELDLARTHPWARALAWMGQVLMVLVLTAAGALYVIFMNTSEITVRRGWALATLLLLTLFVAKGVFILSNMAFGAYLFGIFSVLLATIIMVVAFNQRFALGISAIHALIVTLALGQSLDFYLTTLSGVGLFVFGLKEIRTRSKLIEVGVLASALLAASVWALGLAHFVGSIYSTSTIASFSFDAEILHLRTASLFATLAGFSVACFASSILPRIESTFKITTGSTLLELCDLNQPLLKRLAAEAQGTFNHSLVVGTLAEAAGNAIGANGLLCRVGAYYHDIGKLSKPQYFIENQSGGPNRHDKLSPAMSLLIIVGHVKDGIELAREYSLPWVVHQFIGQHHGTTLVEYFFHAARQRQAREAEARGGVGEETPDVQEVSESEFRYPGPKPQTRETAILMICDGVESIVRSMPEPTAGRVETAVHQLVMKRLMDGQFSECDLTLRDLSDIEQALLRTLAGVYHGRVAYPKPLQLSQTA